MIDNERSYLFFNVHFRQEFQTQCAMTLIYKVDAKIFGELRSVT